MQLRPIKSQSSDKLDACLDLGMPFVLFYKLFKILIHSQALFSSGHQITSTRKQNARAQKKMMRTVQLEMSKEGANVHNSEK